MDVGELLSYKPEQTPKRPNENDSDEEDRPDEALERAKKMRRLAEDKGIWRRKKIASNVFEID